MKLNLLKKGIFFAVAAFAAGCVFSSLPVHAQDASGKVPVIYETDGNPVDAHLVMVHVSGDGMITTDDLQIRNTSEGFYLPVGETKTLKLVADNGASIDKIVINGKTELPELFAEDTIDVVGIEESQTIEVEFSKSSAGNGNSSSNSNGGAGSNGGTTSQTDPTKTNNPQTGDNAMIPLYIGVVLFALIGLFVTFAKKKTSKQQDDNQ